MIVPSLYPAKSLSPSFGEGFRPGMAMAVRLTRRRMLTMSTRVDVTNPNWRTELRTAYNLKYGETGLSLDQPCFQRLLSYVLVIENRWNLKGENVEAHQRTLEP
jgi:hypothetical protein